MIKDFKWINFVNNRFSLVDKKAGSSVTTKLSTLGICFGVMTLIVVLSVMNGFQMEFIDSIIHLSSYHAQVTSVNSENISNVENFLNSNKSVVSYVKFKDAQGLITDENGKEETCLIRALQEDVCQIDKSFAKEINCIYGEIDFSDDDGIILGSRLAKSLGVHVGSKVNLFALSGSGDTSLISNDRVFNVIGIFACGYADINSSYAFINLNSADKYFGSTETVYGIKLNNQNADKRFQKDFKQNIKDCKISVWRDYNRSFFSALRIEKNMLLFFVVMIFIVVAINIFNSIRKLVYERRIEISTLLSLGGHYKSIRNIFVFRGLFIGLKGSLSGLVLGLILSLNIKTVFILISKIQFFFTYIFTKIFNPSSVKYLSENSMWYVYSSIPAKIIPAEVVFITVFGIFSCVFAAWIASSNILKMKIVEILNEQ